MADIFYPGMPDWLAALNQLAKGQLAPIQVDWNAKPGSIKAILNKPTLAAVATSGAKSDVGLGNVDNTSDTNKPVSLAQAAALAGKASLASAAFTGPVTGISKAMVGLGSVDNTSDASKPISAAQQLALTQKAPIADPVFTGSGLTLDSPGTGTIISRGRAGYGTFMATSYDTLPAIVDFANVVSATAGRILCTNGANAAFVWSIKKNNVLTDVLILGTGNLYPVADNATAVGGAGNRFSVVYAGTGSINTSDARLKTPVIEMSESEISAATAIAESIGTYKWLDSIQAKGADARRHIGTTVQGIITIMEQHDLDPFEYAFICYDSWDEEYGRRAPVDGEGGGDVMVREAGDLYSLRNDQLNLFIARGLSARLAETEARLAALEAA